MSSLRVPSAGTLADLESILARLPTSGSEVHLWLPRSSGASIFVESALASVVATLAAHHNLTVIDWIQSSLWNKRTAYRRFGTSLSGLMCAALQPTIYDANRKRISLDWHDIRWEIGRRGGIAEKEGLVHRRTSSRGTSLTFCAFDPFSPLPFTFGSGQDYSDFIDKFIQYRRDYMEVGLADRYADNITHSADIELARFVYEIFRNTFDHGRFGRDDSILHGFRYIYLRKHIDYNKASFLKRVVGFPELAAYVNTIAPSHGSFSFYEVSVADCGLGIVDRFVSQRPEYRAGADTAANNAALINRIVRESLSSMRSRRDAGEGLRNALTALHALRGFLSVRTGSSWLYNSSLSGADQLETLTPVAHSDGLACVVGTRMNMLFPLARKRGDRL